MKNIAKLIIVFILAIMPDMVTAQLNPYTGTWEFRDGNHAFIVTLWPVGEKIYGHYKMIEVDEFGGQTALIYTSKRDYGNNRILPFTIYGVTSPQGLEGVVSDNTIPGYAKDFKEGWIEITLLPSCISCEVKATWKVTADNHMAVEGEPPLNIPTDIILTKISWQVLDD